MIGGCAQIYDFFRFEILLANRESVHVGVYYRKFLHLF
jgi:hypothetical protein